MPRPGKGASRRGGPGRGPADPDRFGSVAERFARQRRGPSTATWVLVAVAALPMAGLGAFLLWGGRGAAVTGPEEPPPYRPEGTICGVCKGSGKFDCEDCERPGTNCSTCNGYGYLLCRSCGGTGK